MLHGWYEERVFVKTSMQESPLEHRSVTMSNVSGFIVVADWFGL